MNSAPHNLPVQLSSFVGRQQELAELKCLLGEARLVTLIGVGGCGKTRLALQVAAACAHETAWQELYPDGLWFVELASISDPEFVPRQMALLFGVYEDEGQPLLTTLVASLRSKRLLLILDNCEHLIRACAQVAAQLLQLCPQVRILATSREALGLTGEMIMRVPSLSLPSADDIHSIEALQQSEAVQLFVIRARDVQATLQITPANAPAIGRICQRLDGIPLAIELAAARVQGLAVEQIANRLQDRFRLLTRGSRTALPRHQTLQAAIDWSYDLLNEAEQALLRRLSVFVGGWSLEAAEAVCSGTEAGDAFDVLALQMSLVEKSLVVTEAQEETTRYRLLETIRDYALKKLAEAGEATLWRGRHLAFFTQLTEEGENQIHSAGQEIWFNQTSLEYDNYRAALEWATESGAVITGLRLAIVLHPFRRLYNHEREAAAWLANLLARATPEEIAIVAQHVADAGLLSVIQEIQSRTPAQSQVGEPPPTVRAHLVEEKAATARADGHRPAVEDATALVKTEEIARQLPSLLTARELDVLRLLADGLKDMQIAERLVISPRTVHAHLNAIYQKLGVNSRSAATRYAVEKGIVSKQ
jgi:predicted ATPase/DNA-binding CsgD family transcriptional regulator